MIYDKGMSLAEFESTLPPAPEPLAAYVSAVRVGNLIYTSGALPTKEGELLFRGKVGQELSVEDGQEAAQLCTINLLSVLKRELGSLEKLARIVKLSGYVQCADNFTQHPQVINGASELLLAIFEDSGCHARTAIGVDSLPLNAAVEVDLIVACR